MRLSIRTAALALAALTATAVFAQQATFRTAVQYVPVDVVVTDRHDKVVTDLSKDDFEITENGHVQDIADFRLVSVPVSDRKIRVDASSAAEPEPDVASNIAASPDARLFAIVVDDLHLIEQDLVFIKRALTDLVNSLSPNDEVALVFASHSNLSINFTRNHSRIMDRVNHVKDGLGFGLDALARVDGGSPDGDVVSKKYRFTGAYFEATMRTLGSVTRALGGSGHTRRAVFLVTGGWTVPVVAGQNKVGEDGTLSPELLAAAYSSPFGSAFQAAKLADVPIYVIDPRGNVGSEDVVRGGLGGTVTTLNNPALNAEARHNIVLQHEGEAIVAVNTGGRAVFNTQNLTKMIRELVQENGSYYLLGYYPTPYVADGGFHEIKVHVKRPGMRVRARQGYEAPSATPRRGSLADPLERAITAGVNVAALPMRVFAQPIASDGEKMTVAVTADVSYPAPVNGSTTFDEHLQLKILGLDSDAAIKGALTRAVTVTGPAPASGTATFRINDTIELPLQPLTLRVAVASQELGKAGSVQMPVEMPKLGRGRGAVALGGIAVGVSSRSVPLSVTRPDAFQNLLPFAPTAERVFATGDSLRLFANLYWRGDAPQPPAVTLTVAGPAGSGPTPVPVPAPTIVGDEKHAPLDVSLPLAGKAPGRYRLTLSAILPGGKPVTRDVLFDVK